MKLQYLVDTNVFLEGLLEQEKVTQVLRLFQEADLSQMAVTDFSLHSIGVILFKLGKPELYASFLDDMIVDAMSVLSLDAEELKELHKIAGKFNLDFDDAYQYAVAEKHDLMILSFDKVFDRTERKRKEPGEVF